MNILSLSIFTILSLWLGLAQALAHVHPPSEEEVQRNGATNPVSLDTSNENACAYENRQGFGHISEQPDLAQISLRRQCTDETADNGGTSCSYEQMMALPEESRNFILNSINASVSNYFEEYFKDFLATELNNLGENVPASLASCINTPERRNNLHAVELQSSHGQHNMVSAIVLNEIYSFNLERGQVSFRPYMERLRDSFPMLYFSKSSLTEYFRGHRGSPIRNVLIEALGEDFNVRTHDGREHHRIMTAIDNLMTTDPNFVNRLNAAEQLIRDDYAEELKRRMERVCSRGISPTRMLFFYPQVVNQAILDMNEEQRAAANFYLCRNPMYYQDTVADTDCDGMKDFEDPAPNDPFSPIPYQINTGSDSQNPPYASQYDYVVFKHEGKLKLQTSLSVNFDNLSEEEKNTFRTRLLSCKEELSTHMSEVFRGMRNNIEHFRDVDLEVDIQFSFQDNVYGDFNIRKCYCTDCYNVPDPDNPPNYLDRSICQEDLTETQRQSVITTLGSLDRWRNRADARNMLPQTECATIKHEVLHRFGLPDEYTDTRIYPYNQTDCNIMGDRSYSPEHQVLKPRQLQEILNPRFNRDGCF